MLKWSAGARSCGGRRERKRGGVGTSSARASFRSAPGGPCAPYLGVGTQSAGANQLWRILGRGREETWPRNPSARGAPYQIGPHFPCVLARAPSRFPQQVITPELFSAKYAWQFTRWFEAKDKKKRLVEAARRAKKPGVPLREVFLEGSDAEFEADWESSDESALAAGARPHGADLADADAAADGSGLTTAALAVARLAARRRGAPFPEPNFDAGGAALDELSDQVARMRAVRGVTVPELVRGKDGARIVAEYEAWVEAGDSANSPSSSMGASAAAAVAPVPADNGERAAENAYIAHLVDSRNHEALYYALVRKRRRLERGGAPHSSSFARFAAVWGPWLQEVDARAFGAGVMGMGAGNAGGGAPAAAAAAAASARERARAADAASQAAEVAQLTEALLAAVGVKAGAGSSAEDAVADAAGAAAPGGVLDARNLIHASRLAAAAKKVPLPADAAAAAAGKEGPPADKKGRE